MHNHLTTSIPTHHPIPSLLHDLLANLHFDLSLHYFVSFCLIISLKEESMIIHANDAS